MRLSLIAAYSANRVIGRDGTLPWNIKKDLGWFKAKTNNKSMIMGRKTAESLKGPLPGRNNIVVSRNSRLILKAGFHIASSLKSAIFMANNLDQNINNEIMIIGGENLYRQAMSQVDRMYLTEIHEEFAGDTHFPMFDKTAFQEKSRTKHEENGIKFDFVIYDRR